MSPTDVRSTDAPVDASAPAELDAAPRSNEPELVIKPRKGWIAVDWRELLSHRELLFFLIWRDVKVKYKQAILGFAWAIFVPLISVSLFTFIGKAAGFDSKVNGELTLNDGTVLRGAVTYVPEGWNVHQADGTDRMVPLKKTAARTDTAVTREDGTVYEGKVTPLVESYTVRPKHGPLITVMPAQIAKAKIIPYAVFVYAGMLPWLFFQASIVGGGMSLVSQQNLLSKIYMPRLFMPTATIGSALIDMGLSTLVFCGMMAFYHYAPSPHVWAVIPLLVLSIIGGLGMAYLLSALTVNFRDMRFLIPFLSQVLMWLSGAMYPPRIFGDQEALLAISPIYGVITGFRSAILGDPWNWFALTVATIEIAFLFVFGLFYFKRAERRFADIA
jgi:lipopolysaccharide transport system permease protein